LPNPATSHQRLRLSARSGVATLDGGYANPPARRISSSQTQRRCSVCQAPALPDRAVAPSWPGGNVSESGGSKPGSTIKY